MFVFYSNKGYKYLKIFIRNFFSNALSQIEIIIECPFTIHRHI